MKTKFKTKKIFIMILALLFVANNAFAIDDNVPDKDSFLNALKKKVKLNKDDIDKDRSVKTIDEIEQKTKEAIEKTTPEEKAQGNEENKKLVVEEAKDATEDAFTPEESIKLNTKNAKEEVKSPYTNDIHSAFTIQDCIKIAVENNPVIRSAVYDAQAHKTKIGQAWSNYFPTLSIGVNGGRDGYRTSMQGRYNTVMYLPTVSAGMLIFDFGKTKATADMAKMNYESKKAMTNETVNVLMCDIKTAYHNMLFAQAQVDVYTDTVSDYEMQLARAVSFYKAGKKAKIDVITAEYNLGKAKLNLVKAQNTLDVAKVQLATIMGIPEYNNFELASRLGTVKYDVEQDYAVEKANEVRPELIAAQKTMEAAKFKLREQKREYAPNINLTASYDNGIGNEYDVLGYNIGIGMAYSSFNVMKVKKQVDEAKANYEKSKADYDEVKHKLYLSVTSAYLDLKTAEDAIVISKLALDEAKEQYRQSSGRYKAGVADFIELKDGETTYLNARLDFYNSLLNYNNTAANLEKEIGIPLNVTTENVLSEDYLD